MPGRHNALNATAAIAVAHQLGASVEVIRRGIENFGGVKRRFTRTGTWNGVAIYDDYGHHPVEIAAVLKAARGATSGKVIAIVQPHRYSRLASLFDAFATCFNDADSVLVADVYPAGEAPIEGADKAHLAAAIAAHGHRHAFALPSPETIAPRVRELARARRHRRLPRGGHGDAMGLCAARRARRARQGVTHGVSGHRRGPEAARAGLARKARVQRGHRRNDLVSGRRAGAGLLLRRPTRTTSPIS